jgi:hypothetical protein
MSRGRFVDGRIVKAPVNSLNGSLIYSLKWILASGEEDLQASVDSGKSKEAARARV